VGTVEQLGFEGMPRRLYSCTPTRLNTWLDCPRRYRMSYLDRPVPPKGPAWAHNSLGASVHNALAGWWRLAVARRTVEAAAALLDGGWITEGYSSDAQSLRYRNWARAMLESYVSGLDPADEPVGVERTVSTRTDVIAVSGRIDRLDSRLAPGLETSELVVVDYKTGRHVLTVDDARSSLAMALYAVAAARSLRRECRRVELHHLPSGRVLAWEHTEESLTRHVRRAEQIAAECADADERMRTLLPREKYDEVFPPSPSPACGWCDFLRHCPEGRAAAVARRPWDGLAELLYRTDHGGCRKSRPLGRVPEVGQRLCRRGGRLDGGGVRGRRDARSHRAEGCCHFPLDFGGPGVVVLAVEDERGDLPFR
jgi:RecB family exonuclease